MASDIALRATALRHDLHAHPEIGFKEFRTSEKIREILKDVGTHRVVAKTGTHHLMFFKLLQY
jgi:metal-dependent amidase/aminoacylase/carboxypeptidase family protein